MKKIVLLVVFISIFAKNVNSQSAVPKVLCIVKLSDGSQLKTRNFLISAKDIDSGSILSKAQSDKDYKSDQADIIVLTVPKKGIVLLGLNDILNLFKIRKEYRTFTVLIQDSAAHDPNSLLADKSYLKKIIIDKNKRTLNIITKDYETTVSFRKQVLDDKGVIHNRISPPPVHQ
jgi:hypothetical protein